MRPTALSRHMKSRFYWLIWFTIFLLSSCRMQHQAAAGPNAIPAPPNRNAHSVIYYEQHNWDTAFLEPESYSSGATIKVLTLRDYHPLVKKFYTLWGPPDSVKHNGLLEERKKGIDTYVWKNISWYSYPSAEIQLVIDGSAEFYTVTLSAIDNKTGLLVTADKEISDKLISLCNAYLLSQKSVITSPIKPHPLYRLDKLFPGGTDTIYPILRGYLAGVSSLFLDIQVNRQGRLYRYEYANFYSDKQGSGNGIFAITDHFLQGMNFPIVIFKPTGDTLEYQVSCNIRQSPQDFATETVNYLEREYRLQENSLTIELLKMPRRNDTLKVLTGPLFNPGKIHALVKIPHDSSLFLFTRAKGHWHLSSICHPYGAENDSLSAIDINGDQKDELLCRGAKGQYSSRIHIFSYIDSTDELIYAGSIDTLCRVYPQKQEIISLSKTSLFYLRKLSLFRWYRNRLVLVKEVVVSNRSADDMRSPAVMCLYENKKWGEGGMALTITYEALEKRDDPVQEKIWSDFFPSDKK